MRHLIICALAIYLGYSTVDHYLLKPAQELLDFTKERIEHVGAGY